MGNDREDLGRAAPKPYKTWYNPALDISIRRTARKIAHLLVQAMYIGPSCTCSLTPATVPSKVVYQTGDGSTIGSVGGPQFATDSWAENFSNIVDPNYGCDRLLGQFVAQKSGAKT